MQRTAENLREIFLQTKLPPSLFIATALQIQVSDTTLTPAPRHGFPKLLSPGE